MRALLRIGGVILLSAFLSAGGSIALSSAYADESMEQNNELPTIEQQLDTSNIILPEPGDHETMPAAGDTEDQDVGLPLETSQTKLNLKMLAELPANTSPVNTGNNAAPAAPTPKSDVALPSTEAPLVPKGMIEDIKKQPLKAITPATQQPGTQTPAIPLKPAPAVATQPEKQTQKAVAKAEEKTPDAVGRVIWVKGIFTAEHKGRDPRKLQKSSIIFVGDTLITDSKTQAQIAFTDTTLMTFRPSTKFIVADYAYNPKEKAESGSVGKFVMDLVAGGFRTITGLISKGNNKDYEVKTPVATIGVRGTDYAIYVGANNQVVIGQLSGVPTLTNAQGQTTELTSETKYATVNPDGSILVSTERPAILDVNLPIVPATVEPITTQEAVSTFGASSSGGKSSGEWCIL